LPRGDDLAGIRLYSAPSLPPSVVVAMSAFSDLRAKRIISQGAMITATKKEKIIAAEALIGIGAM
jgi:hypothetical protein